MTNHDQDQLDAQRYRMLRAIICTDPARQHKVHAMIAPLLGRDNEIEPGRIDRAMDHLAMLHIELA